MLTVSGNAVSNVKNGSAIVNVDNYTVADGKVIFKKEYLATLANGDKKITVVMASGDSLSVIITITD